MHTKDSGKVVKPLIHDHNYWTRHLATLWRSRLSPPFTRGYSPIFQPNFSLPSIGQVSFPILRLTTLQKIVFLLNSRFPPFRVTDPFTNQSSLSLSYGVILPSSFDMLLSLPYHSCGCLPVSVFSTVLLNYVLSRYLSSFPAECYLSPSFFLFLFSWRYVSYLFIEFILGDISISHYVYLSAFT